MGAAAAIVVVVASNDGELGASGARCFFKEENDELDDVLELI